MGKTKCISSKPAACTKCGGNNLRKRITTYSARLAEPEKLAGKEVVVGGVGLYECQSCGHQLPTPAGQAKIDRSIAQRVRSCERPGCYEVFITTSRSTRQKFCSEECWRAMNRVLERERRWREPRKG
jgi:NAD-dependent SIR2 family protein deacetylase